MDKGYANFLHGAICHTETMLANLCTGNPHMDCARSKLLLAKRQCEDGNVKLARKSLKFVACSVANCIVYHMEGDSNERETAVYVKHFILYETSRRAWAARVVRKSLLSQLRRVSLR